MSITLGNTAACRRIVGAVPEFIVDTGRHRHRKPMLSAMPHHTTSSFSRSGPGVITSIGRASRAPTVYQTIHDRLRVVLSAARKMVAV